VFADDTICSGVGIGFMPSQVRCSYLVVNFNFAAGYAVEYLAVV